MKTNTDYNSNKNQSIKGKLIQNEVYLNMNGWVEDYQKNNDEYDEDFENLYLSDKDILENDTYYTDKMSDEELEGQIFEWKV